MSIIIQKFGGTSLANQDDRDRVVERVAKAKDTGNDLVIVVSAMGRRPMPYATDTLIDLIAAMGCDISLREKDLLMACGEIISTVVMTHLLKKRGYDAVALTGAQAGIITTSNHGDARIVRVAPEKIAENLKSGKIVVVAGFQGVSEDGELTTLGRGGSDTTAAALGCALAVDRIEIYTDVDGIMTADPRLVPGAATVTSLSYREVCEMAHLGARVIHPRAVEIAMEGHIPIWIKNTFSDEEGTLIADTGKAADVVTIRGDKVVSGIAHIAGLAQVRIHSTADINDARIGRKLFRDMADAGISIDLINVSPHEVTFTIKSVEKNVASNILSRLSVKHEIEDGFAKVSAVGAGMRGVPGVMATIVEALDDAGVKILQSADSHTSISCLVKTEDMESAAIALHDRFCLGE